MAGCRGTSPQEVLEARDDTGSLPTACPTSRVQPRDVIQRVQGDTPSVPRLRQQLWALRPGLDGGVPAVHDAHGTRQTAGFRMARRTESVESASTAAMRRWAWLRVERRCRVLGRLREGDGHPSGAGGRSCRPTQTTPMPTFGPEHAACRGVLRSRVTAGRTPAATNTWPDDRPTPGGGSSRRSAVIALDSPVRWPAVTRLPLRAPGGGRAARPRPTPMPTFGPERRVPRPAPLQSEPPGGLVRPRNRWPDDRPTPSGASSRRSAV